VAIFGPRANLLTKTALLSAIVLALFLGGLLWIIPVTNYTTNSQFAPQQPVPFSHEHHVGGLGLDCRYCHNAVEVSSSAGMPPTETCMTCHSQIWTHAEVLAPVRQSFADGKNLRWTRVYRLPEYVFFNHSIHIAKGVGCNECHGQIEQMPLTREAQHFYMLFCLNCHSDPAARLRPRDQVFNMNWKRTADTPSGKELMAAYNIHPDILDDCSMCHR
jgi:hypothetical protein